MKIRFNLAAICALTFLLNSCIYEEAVFTENLAKANDRLSGVWVTQEGDDPRTNEYAVCMPIDENRFLLHYPAHGADSFYYEAVPVIRRDRTLLQLRILSTFKSGPATPDSKRFTLLWVSDTGDRLLIRPLQGDSEMARLPAAEARKTLEDPSSNWETCFDEALEFRRL